MLGNRADLSGFNSIQLNWAGLTCNGRPVVVGKYINPKKLTLPLSYKPGIKTFSKCGSPGLKLCVMTLFPFCIPLTHPIIKTACLLPAYSSLRWQSATALAPPCIFNVKKGQPTRCIVFLYSLSWASCKSDTKQTSTMRKNSWHKLGLMLLGHILRTILNY